MSNFARYTTGLRKFPIETINLRFPRKFIINLSKQKTYRSQMNGLSHFAIQIQSWFF